MSTNHGESAENYSYDARLGRILDEFLRRRSAGEPVTEEQLCAQYPELADELREMLSMAGELRPNQDRIAALVKQGVLDPSDDPRYLASLGAYRITGFVGRGGMGIVLKAYEESLNRTVALKLLRPELTDDGLALSRFEREAKAAAALNHANIVTVYAVGRQGDMPFIAMEYVEGRSLSDLIRADGPLPTETVRHIFRQLLQALAVAHKEELLHRDVKSSNILVDGSSKRSAVSDQTSRVGSQRTDADPRTPNTTDPSPPPLRRAVAEPATSPVEGSLPSIKLADFGLARMRNAQTRLTLGDSVLGTPEYMSPEQARSDEEIDHRSDLYSAGVVLYEMLTGRTPFRADAPSAVIHKILNVDPPEPRTFNQSVDPALASLSLRLMSKRPEDRFLSAAEALMVLNGGERVSSLQHRRRARGRRARAGLAATVLLVIVGIVSHLFLRTPVISEVQIGPDGRTVQFLYTGDSEPTRVHHFPQDVKTVNGRAVLCVDDSGSQVVAVGLENPRQNGANVIAFNAKRDEIWSQSVSNHDLVPTWPDCGGSLHWACRQLGIGNLDGEPGDELAVAANDAADYPARISAINPCDGAVISTFWHMGQFTSLWVLPEFLGPGRAAILARGNNNKLDGFDEPLPGDAEPYTRCEVVEVIVVLDPANMDGVGPPLTDPSRVPIAPVAPYAYAFLDQPQSVASATQSGNGQAETVPPVVPGPLTIREIMPSAAVSAGVEPFLRVSIGRAGESKDGGWVFALDRNLQLKHVAPVDGESLCPSEDYWRTRWRPIIQNGAYVDE